MTFKEEKAQLDVLRKSYLEAEQKMLFEYEFKASQLLKDVAYSKVKAEILLGELKIVVTANHTQVDWMNLSIWLEDVLNAVGYDPEDSWVTVDFHYTDEQTKACVVSFVPDWPELEDKNLL